MTSMNSLIDDILDDQPDEWEDLHIIPLDDILPHVEVGTGCMCDPVIEIHGGKLLIIHNAFDGRE